MTRYIIKRSLDIFFALIFIMLLSPIMLITAMLIKIKLGSPIIFKQQRPGKHSKVFMMYKFRTMIDSKDKNGTLLSDEERLTKFGKALRKTSLDELPELFNILKGDMSFVGPRPLLVEYLELYNDEQSRRHEVMPGLTGWAQVNGRNAIDWDKRFELDVWYVDNCSFILDIKIIFMTFKKVLVREGINQQGNATVEKFRPNRSNRNNKGISL